MSYLTDYIARIRVWVDDEDLADVTVTEWIRDAEERMNNELRTAEQIQRDYATFDDDAAILPVDWQEHIYVRVRGGTPFDYVTPREYWTQRQSTGTSQPDLFGGEVYPWPGKKQTYTTIGKSLFVWPPIDPDALTQVEIAYFRQLVPLSDVKDPVFDRYPSIYRSCTLAAAAPFLIEDERFATFAGLATAGIDKANEATRAGRWSGSPLGPRIRGFG
jgi:hypothetical protein